MSPFASCSAALHSIIPAPVRSRSSLTSFAVIAIPSRLRFRLSTLSAGARHAMGPRTVSRVAPSRRSVSSDPLPLLGCLFVSGTAHVRDHFRLRAALAARATLLRPSCRRPPASSRPSRWSRWSPRPRRRGGAPPPASRRAPRRSRRRSRARSRSPSGSRRRCRRSAPSSRSGSALVSAIAITGMPSLFASLTAIVSFFASTTKSAPGSARHVLHAGQVLLQLLALAIEHQALLLRVEVEGALLLAALQLAQPADLLLDRREVREHAAEPALGDVERVRPLGFALDHRSEAASSCRRRARARRARPPGAPAPAPARSDGASS